MKGLFLDSRVGLRVLVMFVLAAGLPMLLLVVLSQRTVDTALTQSETALLANTAKLAGIQTIERLRVARQALLAGAFDTVAAEVPSGPSLPSTSLLPLLAVVEVSVEGERVVRFGREHAGPLLNAPLDDSASSRPVRLRVIDGPTPDTQDVLLTLRDAGSGVRRLGLVSPDFLWSDANEPGAGLWLCALDADSRPLFCSDSATPGSATRWVRTEQNGLAEDEPHATRALFLGADFSSTDWTFVVARDATSPDTQVEAMRGVLPVVALSGLLIAVLLSMVQIRRTMTPLGKLAAGARAIARRQFGTRLDTRAKDEFGELAGAFNHMAGTLEGQFAELEALAAIDRDIVDHGGIDRVHVRVAERLARVFEDRRVAIVQIAPDQTTSAVCRVVAPGQDAVSTVELVIDPVAYARLAAAPDGLRYDDPGTSPAFVKPVIEGFGSAMALPLRWRDRCFGLIAVAQRTPGDIDADALRQLIELRNRAAVAASTADREQALQREARHDSLTHLLNRQGLLEHLQQVLRHAGPGDHALAVLFVDLDRFKNVNDTLGHAAGDQALRQSAERLRSCIPTGSVASRPAGDEFVVVLPHAGAKDGATAVAQAICDQLSHALVVDDMPFFLGASVGVVLCSDPQTPPTTLLRHADHAMYEAKRRGGGRYAVFDSRLDAQAHRRAWIERDLPRAGAAGQLRLLYQPRVESATGRMTSVEALIRWQHPVHGACSPAEFIPIAEDSELIEHLGRWVMNEACAQVRRLREQGIAGLRIAINLSARQIGSDRLVRDICAAIEQHGIRPDDLELEITEGLFVEHRESTVLLLHELRRLGMTIALDDFGTGYSSMSYLRRLPIDTVKVDRAFVKDLGTDRTALAVARAIVAMAHSLGMRTVAEGVETPEQLHALGELRCDELQGFLFSPAVDGQALQRLLRTDPGWGTMLRAATGGAKPVPAC